MIEPTCPASRSRVIELYFMEHRAKLIDIAAFLDRIDRAVPAGGSDRDDFRIATFRKAIAVLNDGDGGFVDVARSAGVTNDRFCKGVAAGDYDNDGDLDLYVSNLGPNRLYRNNGDGTFTDVARQLNVIDPRGRSFEIGRAHV